MNISRETRLQIMLDNNELEAIDSWRFKQRMPSRASAIRELIRLGLRTKSAEPASSDQRSVDFRITET
jgi:metal-responsive CopG/Arc/MetJ family transcriptional regulator